MLVLATQGRTCKLPSPAQRRTGTACFSQTFAALSLHSMGSIVGQLKPCTCLQYCYCKDDESSFISYRDPTLSVGTGILNALLWRAKTKRNLHTDHKGTGHCFSPFAGLACHGMFALIWSATLLRTDEIWCQLAAADSCTCMIPFCCMHMRTRTCTHSCARGCIVVDEQLRHWYVQAAPWLDAFLFKPFREAFGGRVRFVVSGGAPLATHVETYLAAALCCPVFQV